MFISTINSYAACAVGQLGTVYTVGNLTAPAAALAMSWETGQAKP